MIRAVLDEAVPADVASIIEHEGLSVTCFPDEWRSEPDGRILARAVAAGFDWLLTCDKRMPYQQNLRGLAVSVLVLPTPTLPVIETLKSRLREEMGHPVPGCFVLFDASGRRSSPPVPHLLGGR